mmetsp:Transcript_3697/g.6836  ORF Transcript_3697/g.6836 Transcript_3697/m.6836 type:complete len:330 (+) Transcript_3697:750-1739(+)
MWGVFQFVTLYMKHWVAVATTRWPHPSANSTTRSRGNSKCSYPSMLASVTTMSFGSVSTASRLSHSAFRSTSCANTTPPFPPAPLSSVPSTVQARDRREPTCGLSRECVHPVLSQSLKLLKLPTANDSPLGCHATEVTTCAFSGDTNSCRPNASHTLNTQSSPPVTIRSLMRFQSTQVTAVSCAAQLRDAFRGPLPDCDLRFTDFPHDQRTVSPSGPHTNAYTGLPDCANVERRFPLFDQIFKSPSSPADMRADASGDHFTVTAAPVCAATFLSSRASVGEDMEKKRTVPSVQLAANTFDFCALPRSGAQARLVTKASTVAILAIISPS